MPTYVTTIQSWQVVLKKMFCLFVLSAFLFTSLMPLGYAQEVFNLPKPGEMVDLSPAFTPALIKGVAIHPEDPLLFDFIVDQGQSGLKGQALTEETTRLVKYFLAGLAVPEKELWVNLSPAEKDRIMADQLSHTDAGRDMLAQDYILKQITSTLMYPEKDLGRKFWDAIYSQVYSRTGQAEVPLDAFNKVWITPDQAEVYQHNGNAFVVSAHLKLLLESDYLAESKASGAAEEKSDAPGAAAARDIMREVIIPILEKEVNEGKNFASLRQIFHSLILAGWYRNALKNSLLNQVYSGTNKVAGIDISEQNAREKVYAQYLEAYRKGVYNYVKEEFDSATHETLPRKYFAGGTDFAQIVGHPNVTDSAVSADRAIALLKTGHITSMIFRMQPKQQQRGIVEDLRSELGTVPEEWSKNVSDLALSLQKNYQMTVRKSVNTAQKIFSLCYDQKDPFNTTRDALGYIQNRLSRSPQGSATFAPTLNTIYKDWLLYNLGSRIQDLLDSQYGIGKDRMNFFINNDLMQKVKDQLMGRPYFIRNLTSLRKAINKYFDNLHQAMDALGPPILSRQIGQANNLQDLLPHLRSKNHFAVYMAQRRLLELFPRSSGSSQDSIAILKQQMQDAQLSREERDSLSLVYFKTLERVPGVSVAEDIYSEDLKKAMQSVNPADMAQTSPVQVMASDLVEQYLNAKHIYNGQADAVEAQLLVEMMSKAVQAAGDMPEIDWRTEEDPAFDPFSQLYGQLTLKGFDRINSILNSESSNPRGVVARSRLSGIAVIKGTVLDPDTLSGVWDTANNGGIRLKPGMQKVAEESLQSVPAEDRKSMEDIINEALEAYPVVRNNGRIHRFEGYRYYLDFLQAQLDVARTIHMAGLVRPKDVPVPAKSLAEEYQQLKGRSREVVKRKMELLVDMLSRGVSYVGSLSTQPDWSNTEDKTLDPFSGMYSQFTLADFGYLNSVLNRTNDKGVVARSRLTSVSAIKGTVLDPDNMLGVWDTVSTKSVQLKADKHAAVESALISIPAAERDAVQGILNDALEAYPVLENGQRFGAYKNYVRFLVGQWDVARSIHSMDMAQQTVQVAKFDISKVPTDVLSQNFTLDRTTMKIRDWLRGINTLGGITTATLTPGNRVPFYKAESGGAPYVEIFVVKNLLKLLRKGVPGLAIKEHKVENGFNAVSTLDGLYLSMTARSLLQFRTEQVILGRQQFLEEKVDEIYSWVNGVAQSITKEYENLAAARIDNAQAASLVALNLNTPDIRGKTFEFNSSSYMVTQLVRGINLLMPNIRNFFNIFENTREWDWRQPFFSTKSVSPEEDQATDDAVKDMARELVGVAGGGFKIWIRSDKKFHYFYIAPTAKTLLRNFLAPGIIKGKMDRMRASLEELRDGLIKAYPSLVSDQAQMSAEQSVKEVSSLVGRVEEGIAEHYQKLASSGQPSGQTLTMTELMAQGANHMKIAEMLQQGKTLQEIQGELIKKEVSSSFGPEQKDWVAEVPGFLDAIRFFMVRDKLTILEARAKAEELLFSGDLSDIIKKALSSGSSFVAPALRFFVLLLRQQGRGESDAESFKRSHAMALSEEQELDLDSQAAKLKNIDYKQRLAELGGKSWNISYDVFTDAVSSFLKSKDNDKLESARSSLRDAGFGNQQAIALASLISLSEDSLRSANWKGGHQSPIMSVLWHLTQQMPVDKVMEMVGGLDELAKWTQFLQEGTGKLEAWQATDRENAAAAEELIAKFDQVEGLPTENRIILAQAAKSLKDNGSEENAAIATVKSLWAQFSSLSNPDIRARAVLLAAGQLKASDQAQTRATNKTDKMATPTGGIDLGHGEYLKVTGTDASGMPKFDPVQILRLQKDLRGIVPVPVSGPQPVNLRPLFGLNPQAGKDDLQAGQLDPAKLESEDPAGV